MSANKESFREVEFTDGLNLIIAERSEASTDRDSRNGVGKSTLVEIIHFCLGSSVTQKNIIHQLRDDDWEFSLGLEYGDSIFTVRRSLSKATAVVLTNSARDLPLMDAVKVSLNGEIEISTKTWKDILGQICFGLTEETATEKYAPTFRSLVSYFARSGRDAYLDPFTTSRQIRSYQKQVYNAFLVGLNWRHASEWQVLKDQEKMVRTPSPDSALQKRSTLAALENEQVRLIADQQRLRSQVAEFRIVPEYSAVEDQTRLLTTEMRELVNESSILTQKISRYEQQMSSESAGEISRVKDIYNEAGLLFPDSLSRDLSDVIRFHNEVTTHRKEYLQNEIVRLRTRASAITDRLNLLDNQRAELMRLLNEGGAVEDLGQLQFRLGRTQERLEEIEKRITSLESSAAKEATVASGRQALLSRALLDRSERRPKWSAVTSRFVEVTQYLYGQPGEINFGLNENGFIFETKMQRRGSNGVDLMGIYSYDISLAQVWQGAKRRAGFLIHDSLLFEGVDERQIALALNYAKQGSENLNFQYIALINSDNLPLTDLHEIGLRWKDHVRLQLGDSRPEDTLLGFRFGQTPS
ncbi:DUF2326 domain-containing protein [Streptomyces avidinii]|uniref:Uncharacterized protein YydD (DUF2326 family) n=1 Tax=Streptomyces avidinii TaxID=1895 RepID=A0ABS4L1U0_STRAV|nr:DUF2326 domain-containing protein [Streptomyces avidinii]MBP2036247.1 uncharacterized protein YydD (DUF2326 family) [Streptomyces avidinii]